MVKAPTLGQMAGNMSGHGRKTEQLGRAFSLIFTSTTVGPQTRVAPQVWQKCVSIVRPESQDQTKVVRSPEVIVMSCSGKYRQIAKAEPVIN